MRTSVKIKSQGKRPAAGAKSSNVVICPFNVSFAERFLFISSFVFGVIIPGILKLVFYDFKTLKSVIVKSRNAFKKNGSLLHHVLVSLRKRITVKNADAMNLEKAFTIAYVIKKFRKVGIEVNTFQYIILASLPTVTQVITAVLDEPISYREKGNWALGIINACSGNPLIVILPLTITAFKADLGLFTAAQADMQTGAHTATEIRDKAWIVVKHDLLVLMAVAQANSNADTLNGIEIIQSGHFSVKMVGQRSGNIFKAISNGPGVMNLSAAGAPRGGLHDWYISLDGITWTAYLTTKVRVMTATGLVPQTKVWFRHRVRIGGTIGAFEIIYVAIP